MIDKSYNYKLNYRAGDSDSVPTHYSSDLRPNPGDAIQLENGNWHLVIASEFITQLPFAELILAGPGKTPDDAWDQAINQGLATESGGLCP